MLYFDVEPSPSLRKRSKRQPFLDDSDVEAELALDVSEAKRCCRPRRRVFGGNLWLRFDTMTQVIEVPWVPAVDDEDFISSNDFPTVLHVLHAVMTAIIQCHENYFIHRPSQGHQYFPYEIYIYLNVYR